MADTQFGGRITLEFGNLSIVIANASVKLDISGTKSEDKANQDGSACYIYTPTPRAADFVARDDSVNLDWTTLMRFTGNATITELDNGVTHLFTNCRLVGQPVIDRDNGEVSGLKISGGQYQKING